MKKEKGITLVSLVVTIIILIILAGVSINLTLGKNGIITIAKQAKENTELAKIEEQTALNELYTQIELEGGTSGEISYDAITKLAEFKKAIADYIEEAGGIKPEYTADTVTFGENIKGIVKEVTKDATATADNITEGKTAWVNGELITGTGADNNSYYNQGGNDSAKKFYSGSTTSTNYNGVTLSHNYVNDYAQVGLNKKNTSLVYKIPLISDTGGMLYSITYTFSEQTYGGYGDEGIKLTVTGTGSLYTAEGTSIGGYNSVSCSSYVSDYATKTNSLNATHDLLASEFSTNENYVTLKINMDIDAGPIWLITGGNLSGTITCSQIVARYKG